MTPENILILSPHTDDAEIGCGGTIGKLVRQGKNILWLAFSTAEESLPDELPKDTLKKEFISVTEHLGLSSENYQVLDFKVRKLSEKRQEVLERLIEIRKQFKPDLVIGPSLNDFHQDHSVVANEMIRAFKTSCSIICYELPWNHIQFQTQMFVKLSEEDLTSKIEMMGMYKSQFYVKRQYFSESFLRSLAKVRGAQIDTDYAEAFEVIRWQWTI